MIEVSCGNQIVLAAQPSPNLVCVYSYQKKGGKLVSKAQDGIEDPSLAAGQILVGVCFIEQPNRDSETSCLLDWPDSRTF